MTKVATYFDNVVAVLENLDVIFFNTSGLINNVRVLLLFLCVCGCFFSSFFLFLVCLLLLLFFACIPTILCCSPVNSIEDDNFSYP